MKSSKTLTAREELFCAYFVACRNARSAAARAGYSLSPERSAKKLLSSDKISKRISELEHSRDVSSAEIAEGYRSLAFGSVADAMRLLSLDEVPGREELERMELTMISDIKRPKGGGLEIKFFDRLKALDRLYEISSEQRKSGSSDFLTALEHGARALHASGEGDE